MTRTRQVAHAVALLATLLAALLLLGTGCGPTDRVDGDIVPGNPQSASADAPASDSVSPRGPSERDASFADSVERYAAYRDLLATRGRNTYLPALLAQRGGINHRWADRGGERLRVWVQDIDARRPALARRIVADAFADWTDAGIPVAFTVVPDSSRADVIVTWVERFDAQMTGVTRWGTDPREWIVSARIELARRQPDGAPLDSAGLAAIARHEVGHLLGLDHVEDDTSIMASRIRVSGLSEADRRTIRLVYELPAGRLPLP